jgi:phosphoserine phosphatase
MERAAPDVVARTTARQFAIFDLDRTLLPFDTQALFCNFVVRRRPWRILLHALGIPVLLARAGRLVSAATARRAFHAYLWGMRATTLRALAREFARTTVVRWTYPELRAEILRHKGAGRILVLNTASPDFYAREIADALGFAHCIATHFALGATVPLLPVLPAGDNDRGAKISAMAAAVPGIADLTPEERARCWSYSDSDADLALLEFTGNPVSVHPTTALAATARERGWPVLTPARPYRTRWGDVLFRCRQVLGLHGE